MGGSSGGARPKILTNLNDEDWIIKFPSTADSPEIGRQEYDYACCAKECGIPMESVRLFPSENAADISVDKGYVRVRKAFSLNVFQCICP